MPVTAIVLAAGEGTRMKSGRPKVMHKMLDKPLVWWAVRSAREAGAERIVVVVGRGADEVRRLFSSDDDIEFVEQTERLGTGHAVRCVRDALGELKGPVVVLSGDSPLVRSETIASLVEETHGNHRACTVLTMRPADPTGYGRIDRTEDGSVLAIIEHKDCTEEQRERLVECNSGIYCFCGCKLSKNIDSLTNDNVQGEYYLTDMVGIYVKMGEPVAAIECADETELLGVNSRIQLAEATRIMQRRINTHLMGEGVTMLDPSLVWVGPEVTVGPDTEILPLTLLYGNTHVGRGCTLGPNTRLTDTLVGDDCVLDETVATGAVIDSGISCGPYANLPCGTHLSCQCGDASAIEGGTITTDVPADAPTDTRTAGHKGRQ